MTEDPLFAFNGDLPNLSNLHQAERVIECSPGLSQFDAPWRIELPQGGTIRGTGAQAAQGTWPTATEQPPNARVLRMGETGNGTVVLDNRTEINSLLATNNASVPRSSADSSGGCSVTLPARSRSTSWGLLVLLGARVARRRPGRSR